MRRIGIGVALVVAFAMDVAPARAQDAGGFDWDAELARIASLPRPRRIATVQAGRELAPVRTEVKRPLRDVRREVARDRIARSRRRGYGQQAWRLGRGTIEDELEGMARAYLRPSPEDFVFYARVTPLVPQIESLADAFDLGTTLLPGERAALDRLIGAFTRALSSHPQLEVYAFETGWGDAVGSADRGVVLVDPQTRAALWTFTTEAWGFE